MGAQEAPKPSFRQTLERVRSQSQPPSEEELAALEQSLERKCQAALKGQTSVSIRLGSVRKPA